MAGLFDKALRIFWLLLVLVSGAAQAADSEVLQGEPEHILSFDTVAHFSPDGSMEVWENIKVLSLGQEIRRGIFRTLPLTWYRQDGKIFNVDYQIKEVLRDGEPESFSLDQAVKALTVRIGSPGHILQPGIYHYEIRYQIGNHFSRFSEWDELYWNVTGNDWSYPIDQASFKLELPDANRYLDSVGKDTRLRSIDVYTGVLGAKDHNARILPNGSVQTTQPLRQGEGLTVAYTWPRSILASASAPQAYSPLAHLLLPTEETRVIWIPTLILIGFCLLWWLKNVTFTRLKMPPVIPLYAMPATLSPGYLRFITQRKYDHVAFSSDLLDLIARRAVAITIKGKKNQGPWFSKSVPKEDQWLSRQPAGNNKRLTANDRQLMNLLFSLDTSHISLGEPNHRPMQKARTWLAKRCEAQQEKLFSKWGKPVHYAAYITLLTLWICAAFFNPTAAVVGIAVLLLLLLSITLFILPWVFLFSPGRTWSPWGPITLVLSLIICPFSLAVSKILLFTVLPLNQFPAGYLGALLTGFLLCVAFGCSIPRYTQQGLNELAIARGLKLYLGTAERQRYQTLYPPDQWVAHFESLLPAALALGVGKTWANTFAQCLKDTGVRSETFGNADWNGVNSFSQSCGSSSSPSTDGSSGSGSSSSGSGSSGGGSSGGGSGGGGGGGW
ncbi:DUF2207 domain-containing protein [Serratia fonticola]|uniref:DUF2207 domain-containing protein n=1 Tax=Serratia fonticola TaxID=47917 RepID=UPI0020974A30|nr:DUF2207 domain-containing protein [Serratia fonticola]MCO7509616.1 DUF2207 domain-containing protein [Serratia fonticola]